MKYYKSFLTPSEKTLYRSIVGQLNWVAGISRPGISFAVCESSTKFTHATVADIIYVNMIIRKLKLFYSISPIRFKYRETSAVYRC